MSEAYQCMKHGLTEGPACGVCKDRPRSDVWEEDMGVEVSPNPPEGAEVWAKQERYRDQKGEDWIDECARTMTPEEFRAAMKFTIGKYVRRAGKKDAIEQEVRKIADYAKRWLDYERNRAI